jgi:hypothetical protein
MIRVKVPAAGSQKLINNALLNETPGYKVRPRQKPMTAAFSNHTLSPRKTAVGADFLTSVGPKTIPKAAPRSGIEETDRKIAQSLIAQIPRSNT